MVKVINLEVRRAESVKKLMFSTDSSPALNVECKLGELERSEIVDGVIVLRFSGGKLIIDLSPLEILKSLKNLTPTQ